MTSSFDCIVGFWCRNCVSHHWCFENGCQNWLRLLYLDAQAKDMTMPKHTLVIMCKPTWSFSVSTCSLYCLTSLWRSSNSASWRKEKWTRSSTRRMTCGIVKWSKPTVVDLKTQRLFSLKFIFPLVFSHSNYYRLPWVKMALPRDYYATRVGDTVFNVPRRYQEIRNIGSGAQGVVWWVEREGTSIIHV